MLARGSRRGRVGRAEGCQASSCKILVVGGIREMGRVEYGQVKLRLIQLHRTGRRLRLRSFVYFSHIRLRHGL